MVVMYLANPVGLEPTTRWLTATYSKPAELRVRSGIGEDRTLVSSVKSRV